MKGSTPPNNQVKILEEGQEHIPDASELFQTNQEMVEQHPYQQLFTAESGLKYPEKTISDSPERIPLDTTNTNIELYFPMVEELPAEGFTLIRRDGFGGSDSSVLLGVNPYSTLSEIIKQKTTTTLSQEELETGKQTAVMKGNDLEPLIIQKFTDQMGLETFKPTDMYRFKEYPYLTMNFDGITGDAEQYIPVEIKVVTKRGERQYNQHNCIYIEDRGHYPIPKNLANSNNSWQTKAAHYGLPTYYYTQLQAEMFACNAPFGFLCVLWESDWRIRVHVVHKDQAAWNAIIVQGHKAWQKVLELRAQKGLPDRLFDVSEYS